VCLSEAALLGGPRCRSAGERGFRDRARFAPASTLCVGEGSFDFFEPQPHKHIVVKTMTIRLRHDDRMNGSLSKTKLKHRTNLLQAFFGGPH